MDLLARITLLKPFQPGKKEAAPVQLVYGFSDARVISAMGDIMPGVAADEVIDAGSHMGLSPRGITRTVPGAPVAWTLEHGSKHHESALVPRDAVRLWFGDERIPKTAQPGTPTDMTFNFERMRVAARWGGWRMPMRALNGRTACTKGANDFDDAKIGAPRIPVVRIEKLDSSGQVTGEAFEPWAWFDWEADVDYNHPELTAAPAQAAQENPLAGFTTSDLEAFLAFRKAQEAAQTPVGAGKAK